MKQFSWLIVAVSLSLGLVVGSLIYCDTPNDNQASQTWKPEYLQSSNLPNVYELHTKVISGGEPNCEAGFQELSKLKVKSVVSVDGVRPQIELAEKYGIQYVHLPIGYGRIPDQRVAELAKVVRDLPGPIYIHCHHGLHRSPTAAAVALVGAGLLDPSCAPRVLEVAGTDKRYQGLYASARNAERLDASLLDSIASTFPEESQVEPLASRMAQLERTYDQLVLAKQSGWDLPQSGPERQPAHEALMLREHFAELLRLVNETPQSMEFKALLEQSLVAANSLEAELRSAKNGGQFSVNLIEKSLNLIGHKCVKCHDRFRD